MSEYSEFPRLLYRDGTQEECWGKMCDLHIVNDHDELEAALAAGWALTPNGPQADAQFSLLDETSAVIVGHLPALNRSELEALLEAEKAGKTRKGVIGPIEAALAALDAAPNAPAAD